MKLVASTLFFSLSVFLDSIELISSQPLPATPRHAQHTNLTELFPRSNGLDFPPIEEIKLKKPEVFSKFTTLNGHRQALPAANYIRRGSLIFGYEDQGNIALLDHLFRLPYTYAVFNLDTYRWYTLSLSELQRLGVGSSLIPDFAQHTTLTKLFPQSSGVHFPEIEEIDLGKPGYLILFEKLNGHKQEKQAANYLKRGHIIFGYEDQSWNIALLGPLFGQPHLYPVFDTESHKWYTLSLSELRRLGVCDNLRFAHVVDKAHGIVHTRYHKENPEAHNAACEVAYRKTRDCVGIFRNTEDLCAGHLTEHYLHEYIKAFQSHAGGPSGGPSGGR